MELALGVVSFLSSVCAILFGILAFSRNRSLDRDAAAKSNATVLSEIGYIKGGIDDIKTEQRELRKTNTEFVARLTAVEASAKQAHKRIDSLDNQLCGVTNRFLHHESSE